MVECLEMIRPQHQKSGLRRYVAANVSSYRNWLLLLWLIGFATVFLWQRNIVQGINFFIRAKPRPIPRLRPHAFNLTDFGGVGDGRTLNTNAFETAVKTIASLAKKGGGQLNVQAGVWLTAPFNLTSHMTLFLAEDAVILAVEEEKYWPLMPPLPSYGYGREHPGPRYGSLIHGQHLQDVVVTGYNGTIDGNGQSWWSKFRQKESRYTRGILMQFMWCKDIEISNITLRNSPFWTLHPYDCRNVHISGLTILAPLDAPNTDGIDPDSCQNVLIENCYISVGDDCIAIKSGWDQYGISYGRPSKNILIKNLILRSRVSAAVSIGSEMSGGVSNITVDNIHVWESRRGVRIKTSPGRGAYVRNITYKNLMLDTVRVGIVIKTDYGEHPDDHYDPKAFPKVENLIFTQIRGREVRVPVRIYGSAEIPVKNVEFRDVDVGITYKKKHIFQCSFIQGKAIGNIFPSPCENIDVYDEGGLLVRRAAVSNDSVIDYDF